MLCRAGWRESQPIGEDTTWPLSEHSLDDTALHSLWSRMYFFLLSRFPVAAGHMHHEACFVNALFPEIKFSGWWLPTCQNKWFYFCCAETLCSPHSALHSFSFSDFMSSAILLKLIHTSSKAFSIVRKIPSYFKLCHFFILSGNFGCVYPVSPIHMLPSEISQEGRNTVSLLSNAAHQKLICLDFVNEQLTFFKYPKRHLQKLCMRPCLKLLRNSLFL